MELEDNFRQLQDTLRNLHRNILLRKFFFNFINIHYETTIFKAQPTLGKPKAAGEVKVHEEVKIDTKVDEALELAKKAWTGAKPVEVKKTTGLKRPTELKKPVEGKAEVKRTIEPKKHEVRPVAGKKPVAASTQVINNNINPLDSYSITSVLINQELMEKYQELKAKYSNLVGSGLGGQTQGKKAEVNAKKSFMTKLNKKFVSKNIRSDIDNTVVETYAAHKVVCQLQSVLNDESILRPFFELSSRPSQNYNKKEERSQLFKACFIMNWMQKCLDSIQGLDFGNSKELVLNFTGLIKECVNGSEAIEKSDGFIIEKSIVAELLKTCTPEEIKEVTEKYHKLDKWRVANEVNKFILGNLDCTKSLPGLRVIHSLGCKNGKSFCTFTKI